MRTVVNLAVHTIQIFIALKRCVVPGGCVLGWGPTVPEEALLRSPPEIPLQLGLAPFATAPCFAARVQRLQPELALPPALHCALHVTTHEVRRF